MAFEISLAVGRSLTTSGRVAVGDWILTNEASEEASESSSEKTE